ncbi:cupin-like domain-containing protein [Roseateles saccharophilus]|uniref:Cupin-like protein n=1 Tax=Roseateles saccharophilus TaxID=304 RepID=A0A4R3UTM0_ROSSA|nr:cupin-like domain-containing protein [Roseateles saccharophilus]MDG0833210.1 cupin-like domain-containing protein [Roseateles saccharophilus]TCU94442.1 cupin-like protein [Roseateles saccharophilus]
MRTVPIWDEPFDPNDLPDELLTAVRPYVVRGGFAHWPVVRAARQSDAALARYLTGFYNGVHVGLFQLPPEARGRAFYADEALSRFNFTRHVATLDQVLTGLLGLAATAEPPALYVGSTTVEAVLPGFLDANRLALGARDSLVSLWLGNRSRVAAHYDLPDNLAVVAAGRRRFTLFAPEQIHNLYMGPLEPTPAGQPISLVDFAAPDFERFPRFAQALQAAEVAELGPGDALFIPSMWFHHIEGLEAVNLLINAWWRQTPDHMDSPLSALQLALMTIRNLPDQERRIWQRHFQHFVFEADACTWAHVPSAARGLLELADETTSRRARAQLLSQLKR